MPQPFPVFVRTMLIVALLCYPFLMLFGLSHWGITPVAWAMMGVAVFKLLTDRQSQLRPLYCLGVMCGLFSLLQQDPLWLKFYPVCMSLGSLVVFAWTLRTPQSMVERFARMQHPNLPASGVRWTRTVTQVWCGFFLINASITAYIAVYSSLQAWTWYTGFISYVLMGCLFAGEYVLRRRHLARMAHA